MRLFVALEIPAEVRENLAALVQELRPRAPQAKWVRTANLHVTLKFIGHVPPEKGEQICAALKKVTVQGALDLRFRGLGFFPSERRPRVFWAGVECGPRVAELIAAIEAQLEPLGIPGEKRDFSPHLTLARFENPKMPAPFRAAVREYSGRVFGGLHATEFRLVESHLKPTGAEYSRLESFRLINGS